MKPDRTPLAALRPCFSVPFVFGLLGLVMSLEGAPDPLVEAWNAPPREARLRAYWWWLNGNVTQESITRDLEGMQAKGFGGALICDADGSSQDANVRAPHGPTFFTPAWRELYRHTLREAKRLGLEMSLNIQSGWNLGGPMVKAEDAPKKLVWTERELSGGHALAEKLVRPTGRDGYYQDLFVLGYRVKQRPAGATDRRPLQNLSEKALLSSLRPFSAPDSAPLFAEFPATVGEEDTQAEDVRDLSAFLGRDDTLRWEAPAGAWRVLRFGCTLNDHCRVSTCSEGWDGYALDPFDDGAFKRYWDAVVEPLIADAGDLAGSTLKYLHTDSWEVEVANWTPTLRAEFQQRRGYDLLPWLPVIAGKIVNGRAASDRFLEDFRRTFGDLAIDHHFKLFKEGAHRHGLLIHPESGGPHAVPIDAQQCLGYNDAPMSEFWAWSWRHRVGDENRFFVKQPASAAHAYGRRLVLAEGFTDIGPHWQECLWDNLKPAFDHACTEGMNLLVWHAFVCSPMDQGWPGQQYFAGTHLNPNVTWWDQSGPFFAYINRCQAMLQAGLPVADVAYYYGDHVPNFTQLRRRDPARVGAGYDYDVITEEVLLNRLTVKGGQLALPEGGHYRLLVLPERAVISLPALKKLRTLVEAGATVLGPKPERASGLGGFPASDQEVKRLADLLWNSASGPGRVLSGKTAREVLLAEGVLPDFECLTNQATPMLATPDFIHRQADDAEIYFVANRSTNATTLSCAFRVTGKAPELWDPVSGQRQFANAYREQGGRTVVPLDFAPCGSWLVVFREPATRHPATLADPEDTRANRLRLEPLVELTGAWPVAFDPRWGGPQAVTFPSLVSWPERAEPGIRFYSGAAAYRHEFGLPDAAVAAPSRLFVDLGRVRELAEIKVNGKDCGIVWAPPFRVEITAAARAGQNTLEIKVVNFWPNRIIGDAALPEARRLTRTNIRQLKADTKLMESGLLGPVRILEAKP